MDEKTLYYNAVNALGQLINFLKENSKDEPLNNLLIGSIIKVYNKYRYQGYTPQRFQEVLRILNTISNLPVIDTQLKQIVSNTLYTKIKEKSRMGSINTEVVS